MKSLPSWGMSALVAAAVLLFSLVRARGPSPDQGRWAATSLPVAQVLGEGEVAGFERALEPRPFDFPADHGPHVSFRNEWWYLTGNLEDPSGTPFGFQFTVFRAGLDPRFARRLPPEGKASEERPDTPPPGEGPGEGGPGPASPWSASQIYLAHWTVTDGGRKRFYPHERFARGALGLAGAQGSPFRVWVEDWSLTAGGEEDLFPLTLQVREGGTALQLELTALKPPVLQGEGGLSRKGPEPGNASYYYSFSRLKASGVLVLDGDSIPVQGLAWMDREWSTSALSPGQVGWDWFALQLDHGFELMWYHLRRADGTPDPFSQGIWVDPQGAARTLAFGEVELQATDTWASPVDGRRYPARWRLSFPGEDLLLEVVPLIPDQELVLSFRYWEGAVRVSGRHRGRPVAGVGYVELVGYGEGQGRKAP